MFAKFITIVLALTATALSASAQTVDDTRVGDVLDLSWTDSTPDVTARCAYLSARRVAEVEAVAEMAVQLGANGAKWIRDLPVTEISFSRRKALENLARFAPFDKINVRAKNSDGIVLEGKLVILQLLGASASLKLHELEVWRQVNR